MRLIKGNNANEVWTKCCGILLGHSGYEECKTRLGPARELLHVSLTIRKPRQRWVVSRIPAINPAFALAELVWIYSGSNEANLIYRWNPALPKFAGKGRFYHGAYGYRLRHRFGLDQLERAFHILRNQPDSRQVVLQLWGGAIDLPAPSGAPVSNDIPCNIVSILKVRDGRLDWTQIIRSNDLYLGLPYNLALFTALQEVMAGWLDIEIGEYNQVSDSLHLYETDAQKIRITPGSSIANTDRLDLKKHESDEAFAKLMENMRYMAKTKISQECLLKRITTGSLPTPYKNIGLIMGADIARREKWFDLADELANLCTNPALRVLWQKWQKRQNNLITSFNGRK